MLIFITLIFTFFCTTFYNSKSKYILLSESQARIKNQYIYVMCAFLALLAGLRNVAVGPDTYAYYLHFEKTAHQTILFTWLKFINYYTSGEGKDEGFPLLMKAFQYVFPSFRLFLIATALFLYSGVAYIIKTNTKTIQQAFLSIILFVTLFQPYVFSAIRQDIALACVMWSYKFIRERRLLPFWAIILMASTIHKSVLIFIPYYWIATLHKVRLMAALSIVAIPILFVMARSLTVFLVDMSESSQYAYYLAEGKDAGTPTFTALLVCCFLLYLCMIGQLNKQIPQHYYFTNTIYLTLGLAPITWVVPDFMRVLLYFSCFLPIIMADILTILPESLRKYAIIGYTIVIIFLFVKTSSPYEFFWSEMALGSNYMFNVNTLGI